MVCTKCGALILDNTFACPSCKRSMGVKELLESPPALAAAGRYRGVEGWLAFLVFYLLFLLPLGTGVGLVHGLRTQLATGTVQNAALAANLFSWVVALMVSGMGIYAGISLLKIFPNAVAATKRFLIAFLVAGVLISIAQYHTLVDRLWGTADALAFFLIWYAYLMRSKRVANTYPRRTGSFTLPT